MALAVLSYRYFAGLRDEKTTCKIMLDTRDKSMKHDTDLKEFYIYLVFFKKLNKIDKSLARLRKKEREDKYQK